MGTEALHLAQLTLPPAGGVGRARLSSGACCTLLEVGRGELGPLRLVLHGVHHPHADGHLGAEHPGAAALAAALGHPLAGADHGGAGGVVVPVAGELRTGRQRASWPNCWSIWTCLALATSVAMETPRLASPHSSVGLAEERLVLVALKLMLKVAQIA